MPGQMTPEIHKLLASFGYPKLKLISRYKMANVNRARAHIHESSARGAHTSKEREWRLRLRNNATRRAEQWAAPVNV